jgi:hypothetical protein
MASSEVDQKFLGRLAREVERDNPFLSQMLFKILGLSLNLGDKLVEAKRQRPRDPLRVPQFLDLVHHIIWLAREGLNMLEQYVLPWVGPTRNRELIVLACKLRASFLHIYVLFYNQPAVSPMTISHPDILAALASNGEGGGGGSGGGRGGGGGGGADRRHGKGTGTATTVNGYEELGGFAGDDHNSSASSTPRQQRHQPGLYGLEGGAVGATSIVSGVQPRLIKETNYLPTAHEYFRTAARMADEMLWGSHSLRLSVKTEYAAFLYECAHEPEASRKLAQGAITEVYEAQEGMTDDMFEDSCELVAVLGRMKRRGLPSSRQGSTRETTPIANMGGAATGASSSSRASNMTPTLVMPPGMENAI